MIRLFCIYSVLKNSQSLAEISFGLCAPSWWTQPPPTRNRGCTTDRAIFHI